MYKLFNKTRNKYLAYLTAPTATGAFTTLLLDVGIGLPGANFLWDKRTSSDDAGLFTLFAQAVNAPLVLLGPLDNAFAWVAKNQGEPVLLSGADDTIPLAIGPFFLCGIDNDPYAYFRLGVEDQWEFQSQ